MTENKYHGLGFESSILLFMRGKDRILRRRFMDEGGFNYTGAMKALERLQSVGLTECHGIGDYRGSIHWSLTDKGKEVVEILKRLEDLIMDDF